MWAPCGPERPRRHLANDPCGATAGASRAPAQQAPGFCWQKAEVPRPAPPLLAPPPVPPPVPVPLPAPVPPPVPVAPPPVALVPPEVGPVGALGVAGVADEPPVAAAPVSEDDDELAAGSLTDAEVVDVVVAALDVVVVAGGGALATPVVGTVSGGAPAVLVVDGDPLPQADRPMLTTSKARMATERLIFAERALGAQGLHTPAAVRAVV